MAANYQDGRALDVSRLPKRGTIEGYVFQRFDTREGQTVRVIKSPHGKKEYWFCLEDVLAAVGIKYQKNHLYRFGISETNKFCFDGKSRRFVNMIGLLKAVPPKEEYVNGHRMVLELIINFSEIECQQCKQNLSRK